MLGKRVQYGLRPWFLQAHYLAVVLLFLVLPFLVGAGKRPIAGAVYATVALLLQFNRKTSILHEKRPQEFYWYTLWGIWAIASGFVVAKYPEVIWFHGKKLIRMVILIWSSYALFIRQRQHRYLYWTLICLALLQIGASLLGFQMKGDEFIHDEFANTKRLEGITGNANSMGMVMLSALWACVMLWKSESRVFRIIRWGIFPCLGVLFVYYMIETGSRKSLMTLGVVLFGWMVWMIPGRFSVKSFLIACVMGVLMAIAAYFLLQYIMSDTYMGHRFQQWFDAGGGDAAEGFKENVRYAMYIDGLDYWLHHPIAGIGLCHFEIFHFSQTYSQSDLIEPLACTGLVGFILYQGFAFVLVMRLVNLLRRRVSGEAAYTLKGMLLFLVAIHYLIGLGVPHWNRAEHFMVLTFISAYSWQVWSEVVRHRPLYAT